MRYLLDTGVLVRLLHRSDPDHQLVRDALRHLTTRDHTLVCSRQNIVEFWNVCTRPASARGGFNLSVQDAAARLRIIERVIEVLNQPESVYKQWKSLVLRYGVQGKQVHDANIVAVMLAYRVKRIMTLNLADFSRYREIKALHPHDVLSLKS